MADTTSEVKSPSPHTNGVASDSGPDEEERQRMRPADIDADVKEMERRKRVDMIMSSKLFREELERIIEHGMRDGTGTASGLMQQISDMMGVSKNAGNAFKSSNCVVPINDIRGIEAMGYAKGEKILRCKLAAVYRLVDLYGWAQGCSTFITARLNQDEEHFLVNPYGMLFHEITASSLIKVDMQGQVVEQGTTNFSVNISTFSLHAAIHSSRPDIKCIIHVRTPSVVAVSALKCGILPVSEQAVVIGETSTHSHMGGVLNTEEIEKIARNLGPNNKVLILTNQGAVCCGETIEEAFFNARNTVLACEQQLKLMPAGIDNLLLISDEQRKVLYDAAHRPPESTPRPDQPSILEGKVERKWRVGGVDFEALMRMLDNAGFRTGYIYRHPLVKGEPPKPRNDVEVPPAVSSLGYLLEEEELYRQGLWKKLEGGRKGHDRTRWLNSPNVYQKVEILETGTPDPKKITKWVADGSPTHSSTPVKIEGALQFVPKNTNPKEFKKLQQQIKDYRRADKISAGPQSHILEGVTWEEAKKMQDATVTQTGDQVVLMGAASKGIIQRGFQHNATMYKSPYAKNPFDCVTDEELDEYKRVVERKAKGEFDDTTDYSESEGLSSAQINKRISDIRSPTSVTSETEEESRDEPQVLRIETTQAPKASQPEVVMSDDETLSQFRQDLFLEKLKESEAQQQYSPVSRVSVSSAKSLNVFAFKKKSLRKALQDTYYRSSSFSGLPKGSYLAPNPTHYHLARYTNTEKVLRPKLVRVLPNGRYSNFNARSPRGFNFWGPNHPTITINLGDSRSLTLDIPFETLRGFILPFATALNHSENLEFRTSASQTSYNTDRSNVSIFELPSNKSSSDSNESVESDILKKIHEELLWDSSVSKDHIEDFDASSGIEDYIEESPSKIDVPSSSEDNLRNFEEVNSELESFLEELRSVTAQKELYQMSQEIDEEVNLEDFEALYPKEEDLDSFLNQLVNQPEKSENLSDDDGSSTYSLETVIEVSTPKKSDELTIKSSEDEPQNDERKENTEENKDFPMTSSLYGIPDINKDEPGWDPQIMEEVERTAILKTKKTVRFSSEDRVELVSPVELEDDESPGDSDDGVSSLESDDDFEDRIDDFEDRIDDFEDRIDDFESKGMGGASKIKSSTDSYNFLDEVDKEDDAIIAEEMGALFAEYEDIDENLEYAYAINADENRKECESIAEGTKENLQTVVEEIEELLVAEEVEQAKLIVEDFVDEYECSDTDIHQSIEDEVKERTSVEVEFEESSKDVAEELQKSVVEEGSMTTCKVEGIPQIIEETSMDESSEYVIEKSLQFVVEEVEESMITNKEVEGIPQIPEAIEETNMNESSKYVMGESLQRAVEEVEESMITNKKVEGIPQIPEEIEETSMDESSKYVMGESLQCVVEELEESMITNKEVEGIPQIPEKIEETSMGESSKYVMGESLQSVVEEVEESKTTNKEIEGIPQIPEEIEETSMSESSKYVMGESLQSVVEEVEESKTTNKEIEGIPQIPEEIEETSMGESSKYVMGESLQSVVEELEESMITNKEVEGIPQTPEEIEETSMRESSKYVMGESLQSVVEEVEESKTTNKEIEGIPQIPEEIEETSMGESSKYVMGESLQSVVEEVEESKTTNKEIEGIPQIPEEIEETSMGESSKYVMGESLQSVVEEVEELTTTNKEIEEIPQTPEEIEETSIGESSKYVMGESLQSVVEEVEELTTTNKEIEEIPQTPEEIEETSIGESSKYVMGESLQSVVEEVEESKTTNKEIEGIPQIPEEIEETSMGESSKYVMGESLQSVVEEVEESKTTNKEIEGIPQIPEEIEETSMRESSKYVMGESLQSVVEEVEESTTTNKEIEGIPQIPEEIEETSMDESSKYVMGESLQSVVEEVEESKTTNKEVQGILQIPEEIEETSMGESSKYVMGESLQSVVEEVEESTTSSDEDIPQILDKFEEYSLALAESTEHVVEEILQSLLEHAGRSTTWEEAQEVLHHLEEIEETSEEVEELKQYVMVEISRGVEEVVEVSMAAYKANSRIDREEFNKCMDEALKRVVEELTVAITTNKVERFSQILKRVEEFAMEETSEDTVRETETEGILQTFDKEVEETITAGIVNKLEPGVVQWNLECHQDAGDVRETNNDVVKVNEDVIGWSIRSASRKELLKRKKDYFEDLRFMPLRAATRRRRRGAPSDFILMHHYLADNQIREPAFRSSRKINCVSINLVTPVNHFTEAFILRYEAYYMLHSSPTTILNQVSSISKKSKTTQMKKKILKSPVVEPPKIQPSADVSKTYVAKKKKKVTKVAAEEAKPQKLLTEEEIVTKKVSCALQELCSILLKSLDSSGNLKPDPFELKDDLKHILELVNSLPKDRTISMPAGHVIKPTDISSFKEMMQKINRDMVAIHKGIRSCKHKNRLKKGQSCYKGACKSTPKIDDLFDVKTVEKIFGKPEHMRNFILHQKNTKPSKKSKRDERKEMERILFADPNRISTVDDCVLPTKPVVDVRKSRSADSIHKVICCETARYSSNHDVHCKSRLESNLKYIKGEIEQCYLDEDLARLYWIWSEYTQIQIMLGTIPIYCHQCLAYVPMQDCWHVDVVQRNPETDKFYMCRSCGRFVEPRGYFFLFDVLANSTEEQRRMCVIIVDKLINPNTDLSLYREERMTMEYRFAGYLADTELAYVDGEDHRFAPQFSTQLKPKSDSCEEVKEKINSMTNLDDRKHTEGRSSKEANPKKLKSSRKEKKENRYHGDRNVEVSNIEQGESSCIDEGISIDSKPSTCDLRLFDEKIEELSSIIFDCIIKQCYEIKDLILFPEVFYDENISKMFVVLKDAYLKNYPDITDVAKNELRIDLACCVLQKVETSTINDSDVNSQIISDKLFTISEFISDILDKFFDMISSELFEGFSKPLKKEAEKQSTPKKIDKKKKDSPIPKRENLVAFKAKSSQSGNELYWISMTKDTKTCPDITVRKPVVNVDDIPLKPPPDLTQAARNVESRSLSPIIEEARVNLRGAFLETQLTTHTENYEFADYMAGGDYVARDRSDDNVIVSNEAKFFRSSSSKRSAYIQSSSITFVVNQKEDTDAGEDGEGENTVNGDQSDAHMSTLSQSSKEDRSISEGSPKKDKKKKKKGFRTPSFLKKSKEKKIREA